MLHEICCDQFYQKQIVFNPGLSVVLGTNTGDNSIGKSTFLLIVDYVLAGAHMQAQRTSSKMLVPTISIFLLFLVKKLSNFAGTALTPIPFGNAMILTRRLRKSD